MKKTLYLGAPIVTLLDSRRGNSTDPVNASGLLNAAVDRYLGVCRHSLPTLALGEWCAIFDANWLLDTWSPTMMWANVADTSGLGQKWAIDVEALVTAMRGWSYAQAVAVAEAHERFWARTGSSDLRSRVEAVVGADHIAEEPPDSGTRGQAPDSGAPRFRGDGQASA